MKEIKILHLLPNLLSLYGEYANISVLKYYLEKNSYNVSVTHCENDFSRIDGYDLIYIGSGTEDNIIHAIKLLAPFREEIRKSIENGALWLSTGNSLALFGKSVNTHEGNAVDALDIFPFTVNEEFQRFTGDVMTKEICGAPLIGYVNNSYCFNGISSPFSVLTLNSTLGSDKKSGNDGYSFKNFISTSLTGPLLVKNPHFTEYIMEKITGEKISIPAEDNIKKAYKLSSEQLIKRKNNT